MLKQRSVTRIWVDNKLNIRMYSGSGNVLIVVTITSFRFKAIRMRNQYQSEVVNTGKLFITRGSTINYRFTGTIFFSGKRFGGRHTSVIKGSQSVYRITKARAGDARIYWLSFSSCNNPFSVIVHNLNSLWLGLGSADSLTKLCHSNSPR